MLRRTLASCIFALMLMGYSIPNIAQEETPPAIWEAFMITPDNTQLKTFMNNMREHNAKYHSEGPHNALVFNILTGPHIGKVVWQMGPLGFQHLDSRPSDDGHDEHWRDKVMPYVKKMHHGEYWNTIMDYSVLTGLEPGKVTRPLMFIRFYEVDLEHDYLIDSYFKKVKATVEAMEDKSVPWGVYGNMFRQGDIGRHIAGVTFFKDWTHFNSDDNFKETFAKVHGEGSWQKFLDLEEQIFTNSWDEVRKYDAFMSGK